MGARQQHTVDPGLPEPQWPSTLMALGVLLFIVLFWTIGQLTLISFTDLFRWFALLAFAGNFLPRSWVEKRFAMDRLDWFWFNLLAVGPMVFCSCMLLNFFVHGREEKMLVHGGRGLNMHDHWLAHHELPPNFSLPPDFSEDPVQVREVLAMAAYDDVVIGIARGSFGYWVITSRTEIRELMAPDWNLSP